MHSPSHGPAASPTHLLPHKRAPNTLSHLGARSRLSVVTDCVCAHTPVRPDYGHVHANTEQAQGPALDRYQETLCLSWRGGGSGVSGVSCMGMPPSSRTHSHTAHIKYSGLTLVGGDFVPGVYTHPTSIHHIYTTHTTYTHHKHTIHTHPHHTHT